jgi:hypothetical protein
MMYFGLHQIQGLIRISCFLSSETTDAPSSIHQIPSFRQCFKDPGNEKLKFPLLKMQYDVL